MKAAAMYLITMGVAIVLIGPVGGVLVSVAAVLVFMGKP